MPFVYIIIKRFYHGPESKWITKNSKDLPETIMKQLYDSDGIQNRKDEEVLRC